MTIWTVYRKFDGKYFHKVKIIFRNIFWNFMLLPIFLRKSEKNFVKKKRHNIFLIDLDFEPVVNWIDLLKTMSNQRIWVHNVLSCTIIIQQVPTSHIFHILWPGNKSILNHVNIKYVLVTNIIHVNIFNLVYQLSNFDNALCNW